MPFGRGKKPKALGTTEQCRQAALALCKDMTFRDGGPGVIVASVAGARLGSRKRAEELAQQFKRKGWTVVVSSLGGLICTAVVSD